MLTRRELLLGTLGFGTLGLSGCSVLAGFGPVGELPKSKIDEKINQKCDNFYSNHTRILWGFNHSAMVILSYGNYRLGNNDIKDGNYAFVYENNAKNELGFDFVKLPIGLLNKGYLADIELPRVTGKLCNPLASAELWLDNQGAIQFSILFAEKDLTKQEIAVLKKTIGDELWYSDFSNISEIGSATWQKLNSTDYQYSASKHHLAGQKVYRIQVRLENGKLYGHSFTHLFADNNEGMYAITKQEGLMLDKKAHWANKNQIPTTLLTVTNGQILYRGQVLNRLDKLSVIGIVNQIPNQLQKRFGKIDRKLFNPNIGITGSGFSVG